MKGENFEKDVKKGTIILLTSTIIVSMLTFSNIFVQSVSYVAMNLDQIGRIYVTFDNVAITFLPAPVEWLHNFEIFFRVRL